MRERPPHFFLNAGHSWTRGLMFGALGNDAGSCRYVDSSPFGRHGVLTGYTGVANMPGKMWGRALGRAVLGVDGTNDQVPFGVTYNLFTNRSPYTRSVWVKTTAGVSIIIGCGNVDATQICEIFIDGDGLAKSLRSVDSAKTAGVSISNGVWHSLVDTYDGSQIILYVDGKAGTPVATASNNAGTNHPCRLGCRANGTYFFLGSLADSCFWNRPISLYEIQREADRDWSVMKGGAIFTRARRNFVGQVGGGVAARPAMHYYRHLLRAG